MVDYSDVAFDVSASRSTSRTDCFVAVDVSSVAVDHKDVVVYVSDVVVDVSDVAVDVSVAVSDVVVDVTASRSTLRSPSTPPQRTRAT